MNSVVKAILDRSTLKVTLIRISNATEEQVSTHVEDESL